MARTKSFKELVQGQVKADKKFAEALLREGVDAMLSGDVQIAFMPQSTGSSQIESGQLKGLAVTGRKRWPSIPNVPTMKEAGLPSLNNYEWTFWNAAWLPANTPPEIVARLSEWINAALDRPRVKDYLLNSGSTAFGTSPADLMKFQIAEHDKWRKVILAAKISAE